MTNNHELAKRVATLEAEVARLKAKIESSGKKHDPALEKLWGAFCDDPEGWDEIVRLGRQWRESRRPKQRKTVKR